MLKQLFLILLVTSALHSEQKPLFPPALKKGDLIAIVFPASYVDEDNAEEIIQQKTQWLEQRGYHTILYPEKVKRYGYLAGTDAERAEALMNAWKNTDVKAIWCFRGGYGTPRILDALDYKTIQAHPKIFIGMSDITALHQAIQQKTGLVTFLAPVLKFFGGKPGEFDDEYAFSSLEQLIGSPKAEEIPLPHGFDIVKSGKASGRLVGGNLSLVASLCGTPWQIDTKGKILVLEDVWSGIYEIDRRLWQLQQAGLLDKPAAIILGGWENVQTSKHNLTLDDLFEHYFGNATYPVIKGFPSGHGKYQVALPLNVRVEIDTATKKMKMLEPAVKVNTILSQ